MDKADYKIWVGIRNSKVNLLFLNTRWRLRFDWHRYRYFLRRIDECFFAESVMVGLPTKHLSAIRGIGWNRLIHFFGLGLQICRLRERSNDGIPFTNGRGEGGKLGELVERTIWQQVPPPIQLYLLCNKNGFLRQLLAENVSPRDVPYVCIKLLTNLVPASTRKEGMINFVHHRIAEYTPRGLGLCSPSASWLDLPKESLLIHRGLRSLTSNHLSKPSPLHLYDHHHSKCSKAPRLYICPRRWWSQKGEATL